MFTNAWKQNYRDSLRIQGNVIKSMCNPPFTFVHVCDTLMLNYVRQKWNERNSEFIYLLLSLSLTLTCSLSLSLIHMPRNRYENLKGKYYELKRAEMSGEQRPQWLYWKEMDYIVNQMPSNKLRTNLDHRISHMNNTPANSTLNLSTEQNRSTASMPELRDTKPLRLSMQSQDSMGESTQHSFAVDFSLSSQVCSHCQTHCRKTKQTYQLINLFQSISYGHSGKNFIYLYTIWIWIWIWAVKWMVIFLLAEQLLRG